MSRVDKPQDADAGPDRAADRRVSPAGGRFVLPEQSRDDTDQGWGERPYSNDERLLADRPPHWD
ncbi:hypothetical protein FHR38_003551 [Micromonospora polyrhachis]|uniref:Uncharacterized protein n=1 Tax=Micromonospora polyrhachis TaxID=1282883 RepID=A0A7W7SRW4_9ACTN|nr:hypothetical protein [Micromonospora polyrhachis]MBB4959818.1 hypothetical protein [Micromonospora polyrhachis]